MDGRIEEAEWKAALRVDGFAHGGLLERRKATAWLMATPTHLYCAIRSELPQQGSILAEIARESENLVYDDSVELWLDPTPGTASGARYQMLANSRGFRWFRKHPYGGAPEEPGWRGDWEVRNSLHDGYWDCELAVPVASVQSGRSVSDGAWGINLCRNWKQEWAWSSLGGAEYKPTVVVRFAQSAPTVRLELLSDVHTGKVEAALSVTNNEARSVDCAPLLRLERDLMPEVREGDAMAIAPRETRRIVLTVDDANSRKFTLGASVKIGDTTAFERTVAWVADRKPHRWVVAPRVVPPLDMRFAYYPYTNRMRVLVDVSNMPAGADVQQVNVSVRQKGGAPIKTVRFDKLHNGRQEMAFTLPPPKGECEISARAYGSGVPSTEVTRAFERTGFEWERNNLGRSTKVYPPFTPLVVSGTRVDAVLRQHTMSGDGLWTQVRSRGKDLLAGPMRWDCGGSVQSGRLRFVQKAGHRVIAEGGFRCRTMAGSVRSTWDCDGMMRVDMTIKPIGAVPTKGPLDLVIPLKTDAATHYHAVGDGIRNTLYGTLPDGEGTIWTSRQVACNDLPPNFCSYLYVGTPLRGICWFAENDKGWLWDRSTPNAEILRRGSVVEVRIHLMSSGKVLTEPRRISFGLQAAPVKPRLTSDWRHKFRRDNYSVLGTDINWLALGDCGSVYPAGKDMYLWQMLARGNRERLSEEDIQKVIERGRRYFEPYGPDRVAAFEAHARYNLTSRYGTKMIFYYNRSSYQAAPEFETFKDEWCLNDWRSVDKGNGIGEIQIVPSASYVDHALYWYGKSFDIAGNRGVYWDNWFFIGSYNTAMTGAYHMPDGSITPSTGIWGLRELAKRTFQYMNERGMLPITMAHMTSTGILPLLSFATVQYDWEWKYSEGDVQDRFSRDYILMVSNGELAGTWPVVLGDHGPQADDLWTARTFVGSALVHELDCSYPAWTEAGRMQLGLLRPVDEILKRAGVRAFRYWDDEPQPVRSDDPDVPVIVYSVEGEVAVVGVTSYAPADRKVRLRLDTGVLGLPANLRVVNTETGVEIPVSDGALVMDLKKHDTCVLRVTGR
jgi:hypothetical protein